MAFDIIGPSVLTFPPGSTIITQDYNAPKDIQQWSVSVVSSNMTGGYTVSINSSGLLTITIDDLNLVPPGGPIFTLNIVAVHRGQDKGELIVTVTGPDVPCFVTGTRISTARGEVAVEDLVTGDLIVTEGGLGHLPLRHVLRQTISVERLRLDPTARPVRIAMATFGDLPHRDLLVSPCIASSSRAGRWNCVAATIAFWPSSASRRRQHHPAGGSRSRGYLPPPDS
jgi:hypothetical protein